jgi:predicted nucleotidyltransferase
MTASIDLDPRDLETVEGILRQYIPEHEVWAFGSRVRGTAREHSDLDLVVRTTRPLLPAQLGDLKEAFELSNLPMKVDILDGSTLTPNFQDIVREEHVVLQVPRDPGSWRTVRLDEVCEIYDGPHATPPKAAEGPILLQTWNLAHGRLDLNQVEHVSGEDFRKLTRSVTPRAGDLVFVYQGDLGRAALLPEGLRCCLGRGVGLLRAKPELIDPPFLLHSFLGPEFQQTIRSRAIGSAMARLPLKEMGGFPLRIPPMAEQRAIAQSLRVPDSQPTE